MREPPFVPRVYVYHEHGAPGPLPPGDYTPYKVIELPVGIENLSLREQLKTVKRSIDLSTHQSALPFGKVTGFEFETEKEVSIFLNSAGEFQPSPNLLPQKKRGSRHMPVSNGAKPHQIEINLELVQAMPIRNAFRVTNGLIGGPSFQAATETETQERLEALARAGITCLVSLIHPADLFRLRDSLNLFITAGDFREHRFEQNFFALRDGQAPSREQTGIILDVIDASQLQRKVTYLHCTSGCGRTGCLAACWIARHGITGQAALDHLLELRAAYGLFSQSPETEEQRELVLSWRKGE